MRPRRWEIFSRFSLFYFIIYDTHRRRVKANGDGGMQKGRHNHSISIPFCMHFIFIHFPLNFRLLFSYLSTLSCFHFFTHSLVLCCHHHAACAVATAVDSNTANIDLAFYIFYSNNSALSCKLVRDSAQCFTIN